MSWKFIHHHPQHKVFNPAMWLVTRESRIQCSDWSLSTKTASYFILPANLNIEFEILGKESNRRIQVYVMDD